MYAPRPWSLDARSLAAGRVVLGLAGLLNTAWRFVDLRALLTDQGVVSRALSLRLLTYPTAFKLFFVSGSSGFVATLLAVHVLAALMMVLGYRTRLATVTCFLLTLGERDRSILTTDGADDLLLAYLFWGAFLPLGARASLDRLRGPAPQGDAPAPTQVTSLATLGLMAQVSLVYLCTAWFKTSPEWRSEGSAVYYALSLNDFVLTSGRWLRSHRELCRLLTVGTLSLEFFGPIALWLPRGEHRLRLAVVLAFLSLHVGLATCLDLGHFSLIASSTWMMLLPTLFWESIRWPPVPPAVLRAARRIPLPTAGARVGVVPSAPGRALTALALLLMVVGNLHALGLPIPKWTEATLQTVGLDQYWQMFAPGPPHLHGWWVFPAKTASGQDLDLDAQAPLTWEEPTLGWGLGTDRRWRNYLRSLVAPDLKPIFPSLFRYLCTRWNSNHPPAEHVTQVQAVFMRVETTPTESDPPAVREVRGAGRCSEAELAAE